jgi:hypothetical protein
VRRSPRESRFLGLWTAGWLFVFLLGLLLRVGDVGVQWPALLAPVVWALVALWRGRGPARRPAVRRPPEDDGFWPPEDDELPDELPDEPPERRLPSERRLPPTRELPWLPEVPRDRREE